jgi:hypothetical protein
MIIRRFSLMVAAVAVAIAGASLGAAGPASASDNSGAYLCIGATSLPAQCADLLNDNFSPGQAIIVDNSSLGQGLGWNLNLEGVVSDSSPFTEGTGLNVRYDGDEYYTLEKTTATGHDGCMDVTTGDEVVWDPCNSGSADELWVLSSENYWINVGYSDAGDVPFGLDGGSDVNGVNITVSSTSDNPWNVIYSPSG